MYVCMYVCKHTHTHTLTRVGLLAELANHYTTRGALKLQFYGNLLSFLPKQGHMKGAPNFHMYVCMYVCKHTHTHTHSLTRVGLLAELANHYTTRGALKLQFYDPISSSTLQPTFSIAEKISTESKTRLFFFLISHHV